MSVEHPWILLVPVLAFALLCALCGSANTLAAVWVAWGEVSGIRTDLAPAPDSALTYPQHDALPGGAFAGWAG